MKATSCVAWVLALFPLVGAACESDSRRTCEQQFAALVSYRTEAIDYAFGNVFAAMPERINIRFISASDPDYASLAGAIAYDPSTHTLIFPRRVLHLKTPNPARWAGYYWPYYEGARNKKDFPVIEQIDNALWSAFLQQSATAHGLLWPHQECTSAEVAKRLPCEMLAGGIAEQLKDNHPRLFNSNRMDRIWPEDFVAFQKRVWRGDLEYAEVQRYGGILLTRPLINEFGVGRALAYIAQTPFRVEGGNLRTAALQYQALARQALARPTIASIPAATVTAQQLVNVVADGSK